MKKIIYVATFIIVAVLLGIVNSLPCDSKKPEPKTRVVKALNFNGAMNKAYSDYDRSNEWVYNGVYRFYEDGSYYKLFVTIRRLHSNNTSVAISTQKIEEK